MERQHLPVLMAPWIRPAVVRIRKATDACLISVVNRRCPRPCHLHDDRLAHHLRAHVFARRIAAKMLHTSNVMIRTRQKTGMIVIRKLVHSHLQGRPEEGCHMIHHCSFEAVRIAEHPLLVIIAVLFHTGKKPGQRLHKSVVVHDSIPLIAMQPASRIPIVLCQNNRIRVCLFDHLPEFSPEFMVVLLTLSKVCRHVQSPAIHIKRRGDPFCRNVQYVFFQLWRRLIVQLRQGIMPPPSVIK